MRKIKTILGIVFFFSYCNNNEHYCFLQLTIQEYQNVEEYIYENV